MAVRKWLAPAGKPFSDKTFSEAESSGLINDSQWDLMRQIRVGRVVALEDAAWSGLQPAPQVTEVMDLVNLGLLNHKRKFIAHQFLLHLFDLSDVGQALVDEFCTCEDICAERMS